MKFKVLVLIALAAILAIGSVSTDAFADDNVRPRVQDTHRTWEMLDFKFMLSPEFGFYIQPNVRTEHYRRNTYTKNPTPYSPTAPNGQPLGVYFLELYTGALYNLKVDDSFKITFGGDWYFNGSPRPESTSIQSTRNNYPYEHAINLWAIPSYTIGDFTIMGRVILYNQIYEGNTESWTLRTTPNDNGLSGVPGRDNGSFKKGYDESEARGWAMTTRLLVGLEYKLTKTATIFVREEIFYGTIEDNETRFVQGQEDNFERDGTGNDSSGNLVPGEARIAHGSYFKQHGYYLNRFYAGYSLKLTSNVTFTNMYICETALNPDFDPNSPIQADRIQVTGINHYVFIGASVAINLY